MVNGTKHSPRAQDESGLSRKGMHLFPWAVAELASLEELAWVALSQGGWRRRFSKETELGQMSPEAPSSSILTVYEDASKTKRGT